MCALVFLGLNGHRVQADADALHALVDGVASGSIGKAEVSMFWQRHVVPRG